MLFWTLTVAHPYWITFLVTTQGRLTSYLHVGVYQVSHRLKSKRANGWSNRTSLWIKHINVFLSFGVLFKPGCHMLLLSNKDIHRGRKHTTIAMVFSMFRKSGLVSYLQTLKLSTSSCCNRHLRYKTLLQCKIIQFHIHSRLF